jgi:hypothetical protein
MLQNLRRSLQPPPPMAGRRFDSNIGGKSRRVMSCRPALERGLRQADIGQHAETQLRKHRSQALSEVFKKRTAGRCFRCLASDHQVVTCRDPARCFRYLRSGHLARHCRSASSTISSSPPSGIFKPRQPAPSSTPACRVGFSRC